MMNSSRRVLFDPRLIILPWQWFMFLRLLCWVSKSLLNGFWSWPGGVACTLKCWRAHPADDCLIDLLTFAVKLSEHSGAFFVIIYYHSLYTEHYHLDAGKMIYIPQLFTPQSSSQRGAPKRSSQQLLMREDSVSNSLSALSGELSSIWSKPQSR